MRFMTWNVWGCLGVWEHREPLILRTIEQGATSYTGMFIDPDAIKTLRRYVHH
jgi:hypothetical protein